MRYQAIYLVKFTKKYLPVIESWLKAHNHPIPPASSYPKAGYIAFCKDQPIAAGFLRKVEGGYGQIDGMVTNPEAEGSLRHAAQDAIIKQLFVIAKELGINELVSFTRYKVTLERGLRHGFKSLDDYSLIAINLK